MRLQLDDRAHSIGLAGLRSISVHNIDNSKVSATFRHAGLSSNSVRIIEESTCGNGTAISTVWLP